MVKNTTLREDKVLNELKKAFPAYSFGNYIDMARLIQPESFDYKNRTRLESEFTKKIIQAIADITLLTQYVNAKRKAEILTSDEFNHFMTRIMDFSKFGNIEIQPLTKIKRITGKRLQQAWQAIPHVTQFDKCDISNLEELRLKWKKTNSDPDIKASLIPFFIKALGYLLSEMPQFNSSLDSSNKNLVLKKYINVGVAVDTAEGLVVPVIKDVKDKSILEMGRELTLLSRKARDKQLKPADMEGGCFTISSLGGIGGSYFTPIVNPPEVAILGISRYVKDPKLIDGKLQERLILPFSLSYDHRVIDGTDAARFTTEFGKRLSEYKKMV